MEGKCFPKRNLDLKKLKDGTFAIFAICLLAKQAVIYLGDCQTVGSANMTSKPAQLLQTSLGGKKHGFRLSKLKA